jgi:hypothetical protein
LKHLNKILTFLTLSLIAGCAPAQPPSPSLTADDEKFAKIVRYYREMCPTTKFEGHGVHFRDGPNGTRLHINVPVAVEEHYMHSFSPDFLAQQSQQSKESDGLARMIAEDLSHLRRKRLFSRSGTRASHCGVSYDCVTYVVEVDGRP